MTMLQACCLLLLVTQYLVAIGAPWSVHGCASEEDARLFADEYNNQAQITLSQGKLAYWDFYTNMTENNKNDMFDKLLIAGEFIRNRAAEASKFDWKNFEDPILRREIYKIATMGDKAEYSLEKGDLMRMLSLKSDLQALYGNRNKRAGITTGLRSLSKSGKRRYNVKRATGAERNGPELYEELVGLVNQAARSINFTDTGAYWRSGYESVTFEADCERLWLQLKPLYVELHAYIRRKLKEKNPTVKFPVDGHIPQHLIDNTRLSDLVRPYPSYPTFDVTQEMIAQNYTPLRMFKLSEEFFTSLGLLPMPQAFWDKSMLEKPKDREVQCHPTAFDFYNGKDFRVKMCTNVNMGHLITIHHEMGHIQYHLQYKDQPVPLREGVNMGFHEAIGDVLALSVATPEHLTKIDLLPADFVHTNEAELNFLMKQALAIVTEIPSSYLVDKWRWGVFSGDIRRDEYNSKWRELRCRYAGYYSESPMSDDRFEAVLSTFHVSDHMPYIRYFIANILQFQFHEALCETASNTKTLHRCDIYKSLEAGKKLGDMLKLGASVPWPDALEMLTGSREMSVKPLLDYYRPLQEWLEQQNDGHPKGWTDECPVKKETCSL